MKQISGYVLVKETNEGVPNLIVTAYDSEKSIEEIIGNDTDRNALDLIDLGKRIGSVLTDQTGQFTLKSEELEYQGNESRPDLLLIVLAPEDIQGIEKPYPLPPNRRLLYISSAPLVDAGAEEAFLIRLLQAQLNHFGISVATSSRDGEANNQRIADAIEITWKSRDSLRKKLLPRLEEEQKNIEDAKKIAQAKVKHLSAIPMHLRDDKQENQFFINGKKDLAKNLVLKQEQIIAEGLERFKTYEPILHLSLTKDDMKELGLRERNGEIVRKPNSVKISQKLGSLIKGFDLVRLRGLNNPSPDELEQKYLVTRPIPSNSRGNHHRK